MLHDAIQSLRPDKGFTMTNDDPSTIIWQDESVITPTQSEIDAAVKSMQSKKIADEKAKEAARKTVLEKLGLSADEAALLLQ
jgi:hypothetical protein